MSGRHGGFRHGEVSARAAGLTVQWSTKWSQAEPLGRVLREAYPERWVRFHSLPGSKQYADSDAERRETLRRHRAVLRELSGEAATESLVLIAEDWDRGDVAAGWSRRCLPRAWPWKTLKPTDLEGAASYLWVESGLDDRHLDALLMAAADDEAFFVVADPELAWIYCPYDGGGDVLVGSQTERDALRGRHVSWLSSHPAGL